MSDTRTLIAAERPEPRRRRGRRSRLVLGAITGVWAAAMTVGLLLPARAPGRSADETVSAPPPTTSSVLAAAAPVVGSAPAPEVTMPVATPVPTPVPTPAAKRRPRPRPKPTPVPSMVVVDFQYPVRSGTLRIWMDDEVLLGESIHGRVDKDLLLVKLRSGVFTDVMRVEPGRHDFRVEVRWDDEVRSERIRGRLLPGETHRLQIRLGRLKKDLSLEWTH